MWLGHTLRHGDLVPLVTEGRIIGKRPPGRPRAGMMERVKDGSPYAAVRRRALDRELQGSTCLWAEHTHTRIGYSSIDDLRRTDLPFTDLSFVRILLLV